MKVYIAERCDKIDYDECIEQTIIAKNKENALRLANKEYGQWEISREVDMNVEQVLTQHIVYG